MVSVEIEISQVRITMTSRRRELYLENLLRSDRAAAVCDADEAVANRAPYSYAELAAAHRTGSLVELLAPMDSYTLRAQALRYCVEAPHGTPDVDEVERRFVRLLTEARWPQAA
jgi:hypothetical protein